MPALPNASAAGAKRAADSIRDHLMRYVGPFTAKNAVQMLSKQTLGIDADAVTMDQAPTLVEALGPMLRTLLGKVSAEKVIEQLKQELGVKAG
jgi:hypothetical protein